MPLRCTMCQRDAELTAQGRTIDCEGMQLHCLIIVSSCTSCGHRWEDETCRADNLQFFNDAYRRAAVRQQSSAGVHDHVFSSDDCDTDC